MIFRLPLHKINVRYIEQRRISSRFPLYVLSLYIACFLAFLLTIWRHLLVYYYRLLYIIYKAAHLFVGFRAHPYRSIFALPGHQSGRIDVKTHVDGLDGMNSFQQLLIDKNNS